MNMYASSHAVAMKAVSLAAAMSLLAAPFCRRQRRRASGALLAPRGSRRAFGCACVRYPPMIFSRDPQSAEADSCCR